MFVTEFFHLSPQVKAELVARSVPWGFGAFSEMIYYSRYSRLKDDGTQETWADTVIRNIEGMFSILKTAAKSAGRQWNDDWWSYEAERAAKLMFELKWTPPGRGMWAQGTQFVYERGSDALNNCAFVEVTRLSRDAAWLMDKLMKGVGVGFDTYNLQTTKFQRPRGQAETYIIPDSREGWVESVRRLIRSYESDGFQPVNFDYSRIRAEGEPIRGFGGISGGYKPLERLHEALRSVLSQAVDGEISRTRLITDVMNQIGVCVIAGNVRRSAEIALGHPLDEEFYDLKDWRKNPERSEWMHMSNNSIVLNGEDDDAVLPNIAERIAFNGEPGIINLPIIRKYGRYGEEQVDTATGINPCGEVPLESYETCNLSIVFPTRCATTEELMDAVDMATLYSMSVTLLPSDNALTQRVVERNHRIGVGMSGLADWRDGVGRDAQLRTLDDCYERVFQNAQKASNFFGISMPIRMTTVKPDGTASLLAGVSPGMHWPWSGYALRRVRQSASSPQAELLKASGIPYEEDVTDSNTLVFEYPIVYNGGKTRSQKDVSLREQMSALEDYQRHWADNSVSATLTFKKEEISDIEGLLRERLERLKSASFLLEDDNVYAQAPLEALTEQQYRERVASLRDVDWAHNTIGDGEFDLYCDGDSCTIAP